ncbi:MAG TPA: hypothetical protein PL157_02795, partial [Acidobacteriota bacterium]|nr:hypothetical protein [Acidobacteriota bacterium]
FFILHSSFFILHSSFFILHSSFFILHSLFSCLLFSEHDHRINLGCLSARKKGRTHSNQKQEDG